MKPNEQVFKWLRDLVGTMPIVMPTDPDPPYYDAIASGQEYDVRVLDTAYAHLPPKEGLDVLWQELRGWLQNVDYMTRCGHDLCFKLGVELGQLEDTEVFDEQPTNRLEILYSAPWTGAGSLTDSGDGTATGATTMGATTTGATTTNSSVAREEFEPADDNVFGDISMLLGPRLMERVQGFIERHGLDSPRETAPDLTVLDLAAPDLAAPDLAAPDLTVASVDEPVNGASTADADIANATAVPRSFMAAPQRPRNKRWHTLIPSAIAVVCMLLFCWQLFKPTPAVAQTVTLHRSSQVSDLTVILSHADKTVDGTRLHVYMVNDSNEPRVAGLTLRRSEEPDSDLDAFDDSSDLRPMIIPPRSTVHQVVEMPNDNSEQSLVVRERRDLSEILYQRKGLQP